MKPCIALVWLVMLAVANLVHSAEPPKVAGRQTKTIEGWTLLISDELMEQDKAGTERALELLTVQLQEITRVVPARSRRGTAEGAALVFSRISRRTTAGRVSPRRRLVA